MASCDLKGQGATEGPPYSYVWTPPSLWPHLLPWLALLALLAAKPNRTAQAWWILCPLGVVVAVTLALTGELLPEEFVPSEAATLLEKGFSSLSFGLAAVWLLAPVLEHRLRFVSFLKMVLAAGLMAGFAFFVRQNWDEPGEVFGLSIVTAVCIVLTISGLCLGGLVCRRRYRPLRLTMASGGWLVALALGLALPFFLFALAASGGAPLWTEFLFPVLVVAGACFAVLLPFLVLAYSNSHYRARLQNLLHLEALPRPPMPAPAPLSASAAGSI